MVDIFNSSMLDKYDMLDSNLIFEVLNVLNDNSCEQDFIIKNIKGLNIKTIKDKLREKGVFASEKDIFMVLQILLSSYQNIVRDDYFSACSEYKVINNYYWKSKLQQCHYSFKDDVKGTKTMLLISDVHIGNDVFFNAKLVNNIYDYAIKNGATITLNFGDLFEGLPELRGEEYKINNVMERLNLSHEEFSRQLNIFINEYPNPTLNEMRTFCMLGNHDETMNRYMNWSSFHRLKDMDLRILSIYNPSFNMFLRSNWDVNLNNIDFHFNHRLYKSGIIRDMKINKLEDIDNEKERLGGLMLDNIYDVFLSGHLHKGFIYPDEDYFRRYDTLYLTVPSTSNICIGKAVAYLLYMYPETNGMEISVLGCDNNMNIYEIERIEWKFKSKNKIRARML